MNKSQKYKVGDTLIFNSKVNYNPNRNGRAVTKGKATILSAFPKAEDSELLYEVRLQVDYSTTVEAYCFESELSEIPDQSDIETVELPIPSDVPKAGPKMPVSIYKAVTWPCEACHRVSDFANPMKATGDFLFWICETCGESILLTDEQIAKSKKPLKSSVQKALDFNAELRSVYLSCALPEGDEPISASLETALKLIDGCSELSSPQKNSMYIRVSRKLKAALATAILAELPN